MELCRSHHITGFPSIRVFRKGSDDITVHGIHEHESYRGAAMPAGRLTRSSYSAIAVLLQPQASILMTYSPARSRYFQAANFLFG